MKLHIAAAIIAALAATLLCSAFFSGVSFLGHQSSGMILLVLAVFMFAFMKFVRVNTFRSGAIGAVLLILGIMQIAGVSPFIFKVLGFIFFLFGMLTFMQASNLGDKSPVLSLGMILFIMGIIVLFV